MIPPDIIICQIGQFGSFNAFHGVVRLIPENNASFGCADWKVGAPERNIKKYDWHNVPGVDKRWYTQHMKKAPAEAEAVDNSFSIGFTSLE